MDDDCSSHARTLRIAVFAGLAEACGGRILDLPWAGGRVSDLRARVAATVPAAAGLLARSAVVVDGRHAADAAVIPCGADIAILPPVSGG